MYFRSDIYIKCNFTSPDVIWKEAYGRILKENFARLIEAVGTEDAHVILEQKNMYCVRMLQTTDYWYTFRKYFTWNNIPIYRYTMKSLLTIMQYSQVISGCFTQLL